MLYNKGEYTYTVELGYNAPGLQQTLDYNKQILMHWVGAVYFPYKITWLEQTRLERTICMQRTENQLLTNHSYNERIYNNRGGSIQPSLTVMHICGSHGYSVVLHTALHLQS